MAYARFGHDKSDVYVFRCGFHLWTCCGCLMDTDDDSEGQLFHSPEALIEHLEEHQRRGETVPLDHIKERLDEYMRRDRADQA